MLINHNLLHVTEDLVKDEKALIILVHGIAEHSGRYQDITHYLNERGFSVVRYDLRGHGLSMGERGKIDSFHTHVDDLYGVVTAYRNKHAKIYLIGHSLGGLIVHIYAVKYQGVDGVITSGAPTGVLKEAKPLLFTGVHLLKWVKMKTNFADNKLSRRAEVEQQYKNDPLNLPYFYLSLVGQMFIKGVKYLKRNIKNYQTPVLLLHGMADKIVPYQMSEQIYQKISVEDKSLILYKDAYHELFNDLDYLKTFADISHWLEAHL